MTEPIIQVQELSKAYQKGSQDAIALQSATFSIERGEFVAIMGPSGSGKSTLLYVLGCLIRPTGGIYQLEGNPIAEMNERELAEVRGRYIGFVFQSFQLLPSISALRNVELPSLYNKQGRRERRERARELLERVGLGDRVDYNPTELSGGQSQRVAIARALMNDPSLILADEPTGNLDRTSGRAIMDLLQELHDEGRTIIMVTHDPQIIQQHANRILQITDGVLEA